MSQLLIIRADAGPGIGAGHVMRCLALAEAWQAGGGTATLVTVSPPQPIRERLEASGVQVREIFSEPGSAADSSELCGLAAETPPAWVVVDGYAFDGNYQHRLKEAGLRVLFIDDYSHAKHYWADFVLNQNLGAHAALYESREPATQLLIGSRYVLLRREFLKWRDWQRVIPETAQKILVTLGGSDPDNVTLKVLQALQQLQTPTVEAKIVVGPLNRHFGSLRAVMGGANGSVQLLSAVDNMPELMAWADTAISAGGSTCCELAFMGLPALLFVLAENQQSPAQALDAAGVAVNLGSHENIAPASMHQALRNVLLATDRRADMSRRGRALVDSEGADRVLMRLRNQALRLRSVRAEDCRLLWAWANEPEVRTSSFSSEPIPWEQHVAWFGRKIQDPCCRLFLGVDEHDSLIGQARVEGRDENQVECDVSVCKEKRGLGYGHILIRMAVEEVFRRTRFQVIHAFVKTENNASVRAFEKAGFRRVGLEIVKGQSALHFVYER